MLESDDKYHVHLLMLFVVCNGGNGRDEMSLHRNKKYKKNPTQPLLLHTYKFTSEEDCCTSSYFGTGKRI